VPHKQAEHMAAPTSRAISVKSLDSKEPSTHGTKLPCDETIADGRF